MCAVYYIACIGKYSYKLQFRIDGFWCMECQNYWNAEDIVHNRIFDWIFRYFKWCVFVISMRTFLCHRFSRRRAFLFCLTSIYCFLFCSFIRVGRFEHWYFDYLLFLFSIESALVSVSLLTSLLLLSWEYSMDNLY